ncbi:MAG: MOSC domain-containing protein [Dongiaceae bacterium]
MTDIGNAIGTVAELWRYPVQSMGGEQLRSAELTESGLVGDRAYGLVDPEIGEVVSSAQGKRKWRGIVTLSARYLAAPDKSGASMPVEITLPSGDRLTSGQPDLDERLSSELGSSVHFADKAKESAAPSYRQQPLHILTTASLRRFSRHYPEGRFVAARFRPNLVLDTGATEGFAEQGWIGQQFRIGDSLVIAITDHCKRCVMTTLPQGEVPFDPAILHTVTQQNGTQAGVYASVVQPGQITLGDPVRPVG